MATTTRYHLTESPAHMTQPLTQTTSIQNHHSHQRPTGTTTTVTTSSTTSSTTSTPTFPSPSSAASSHQIGFIGPRRKSPLYVPAVLRPNRYPPSRPEHITPPSSIMEGAGHDGFIASPTTMSRRSTASTMQPTETETDLSDFELGLQGLGKVTAPPSKEHWKSDASTAMCDAPTCTRSFSYFTRKHHCRRCGNIFCDAHSTHAVPLDQDANYHPGGAPSRACGHCSREYKAWWAIRRDSCRREGSESSGGSESSAATEADEPVTPTTPSHGGGGGGGHGLYGKQSPMVCAVNVGKKGYFPPTAVQGPAVVGSLGSSVPRDWHWSTF